VKNLVEHFIRLCCPLFVVFQHWDYEAARPSVQPRVGLSLVASGDSNQDRDVVN
jgi:hypothetical protein